MLNWITPLLIVLLLTPALLSLLSRFKDSGSGLHHGRLQKCPASPNCIQSEDSDHPSYADPVHFTSSRESAWQAAVETVQEMGGVIIIQETGYLHATFASSLFRFVDDMELRLDTSNPSIHFRSSSRVGYSDLGANRKRIEDFRHRFNQKKV